MRFLRQLIQMCEHTRAGLFAHVVEYTLVLEQLVRRIEFENFSRVQDLFCDMVNI